MDYNYIQHTINGMPVDVFISPFNQTIWLSLEDMSCLFAEDDDDIEAYIEKLFDRGVVNKDKDYDSEKELYSLGVVVFVGTFFRSINLKPFVDWSMKLIKAYQNIKNIDESKFATLVNNVIDADSRVNNLVKEKKSV